MATSVLSGVAVHQLFLDSLRPLCRTIGLSLGPSGRAVLFNSGNRTRKASSAVDIAREFSVGEGCHSLAPRMFKETMIASDREHGDGSARLALIAGESFGSAVRMLGGQNSATVANAMTAVRERVAFLLNSERRVFATAFEVAMAAGADEEFADVLATLFHKVGMDGTIEVLPSGRAGISTEVSSGFVLEAEAVSPRPPTGNGLALSDVHIVAAREVISDFGALAPVIEGFVSRKKGLLIVARDIIGDALAMLERNRVAEVLSVIAVKPADAGPRGDSVIGDLAVATGGLLVGETEGTALRTLKPSGLGKAASLCFSGNRLYLSEPRGDPTAVLARCGELEGEIARNRNLSLDREHAERRKARLQGRWAEIRVGATTTFEADSLLVTARGAIGSMRSAQRHGVVSGAGRTLSRVAERLEGDHGTGVHEIAAIAAARGLRSIERCLVANAGLPDNLAAGLAGHRNSEPFIPDPFRLTQAVVDQALSLASMMLSVDAAVYR